MEKVAVLDCLKRGVTVRNCQDFDCPKPEEAITQLFGLTIDDKKRN